jgi:hypothetical protein
MTVLLIAACCCTIGCETLYEAGVPGMDRFIDFDGRAREEESFRVQFQEERSPAAMQWLLANRIQTGMTVSEVGHVFGEAGTREFHDSGLKVKGGNYRIGDQTYYWGPDSSGRSIYLIFREGTLVNFDPNEFRDPI